MIGQTVSHYKIVEKLGEGGMGEVFLAEDMSLGRKVAVKFLSSDKASDPESRQRFVHEARAQAMLSHPNIATFYEVGEAENQVFIVMEYIEGQPLSRLASAEKLSLPEILDLAIQVCEGLQAAHEKGITHRDIKPENVLVTVKRHAKITDFGLAKWKGATTLTKTGARMGTAFYMSPEQVEGKKVDNRTDIFSLGVVLYELLCARRPFEGDTDTAIFYDLINTQPQPLARFARNLPDQLEKIVMKCLAKKPEERYQSAADLVADLRIERKNLEHARSSGLKPAAEIAKPKKRMLKILVPSSAVVVLAVLFFVFNPFKVEVSRDRSEATGSFQEMKFSRLTSSGKVSEAVISADGRYVVYVLYDDLGKQSLWVRQLATGSNVQISPPAEVSLQGLTFSPNGDFLYYNQWNDQDTAINLYQIPVLGGHPKKIIEDVASPISLSPDGKRMVFIRWVIGMAEGRFVVANLDGSGERILMRRKAPLEISSPAWSPDGKSIAYAGGGMRKLYLFTIPPEGGTEKKISEQSWSGVERLVWFSDGRGLALIADGQIWEVSYPGGEVRRITNDLNNYGGISVTADRKKMVTVQADRLCNVWIMPGLEAARAKQVTFGKDDGWGRGWGGVSWTPEGKVVYASNAGGSPDLWIMDADGSNARQLTNDGDWDGEPKVSPDGRYIVFTSERGEGRNIWRMEIDGTNLKQLSKGNHEDRPVISPDGKWVIYVSWANDNYFLWKLPLEGGEPVRLTDKHSHHPAISPDGKLIACQIQEGETGKGHKIAILPFEGGSPLKIINKEVEFKWMPGGEALCYADDTLGVANLFSLPLDGSPPKQLTDFKTDWIFGYDWSKDGKQLVMVRGTVKHDAILITNF